MVSLTFRSPGTALGALSPGDATLDAAAVPGAISDGVRCLRLRTLTFTFSRIELKRADDLDDEDTDDEFDDEDTDARNEVRFRGPADVTLRFADDGSFQSVRLDESTPRGTFDEIEFRIDRIRADGRFGKLVGGVCGDEFNANVPVREKVKIRFGDPLVIDGAIDQPNITVLLEPAQLFFINGVVINPKELETNQSLRERFRARIRAVLRAFKDANRNGRDDRDSDSDHRGHG